MKQLLRSFFGLGNSSSERIAVGHHVHINIRDFKYLKASKERLTALHDLYNRYKNTVHAQKIKEVLEKTESIHHYLVSRNRVHELELFHLRHTDHFLNTFTIILDVHQKNERKGEKVKSEEPVLKKLVVEKREEKQHRSEASANRSQTTAQKTTTAGAGTDIPTLAVPEVVINTFENISYVKKEANKGDVLREIGYTSTQEEKQVFLDQISGRLGIKNIYYVGNAILSLQQSTGGAVMSLMPIIYWEECMYAINLKDFRLFPVQMFRKR